MAGAGYKLFNTGDVLTAAQVNTYLQEQTVMVFANATARTTALSGVLAEGMMSYLQDTNAVEVYNGSAWVSVGSTGDITAVTAGTGISGGGTSGDVTITNSMATAIDAKGDLIAGTGADTFSRLAVGANNTVLTADSSTATGLKWATPSAASFVGALVGGNTQTISNATATAVAFASTEIFDTDGFHSTSSNTSRITIPSGKAGYYAFFCSLPWQDANLGSRQVFLYKNGSEYQSSRRYLGPYANSSYVTQEMFTIANAAVSDYFEIFAYQSSGGNLAIYGDSGAGSLAGLRFGCAFLGA